MKYLALVMLVSSIFAGSANAMPKDHVVPMYSPNGTVLVPGPSASKMLILPARPVDRIFLMRR